MLASRPARLALSALLVLLAGALILGCGDDDGGGEARDTASEKAGEDVAEGVDPEVAERAGKYEEPPKNQLDPKKRYVVHVTTNKGSFDIVLDQKAGPIAAANFAFLVEEGFYDGVVFHRIIKDFMVQTGDPTGTGTGDPGYSIKDDKVTGSYSRGTVAMANAGPDTGGSQFFIVHGTEVDQMLGKNYPIFGRVDEEGMKVVDEIASVEVEPGPTGEPSQPTETVVIEKMELEEG